MLGRTFDNVGIRFQLALMTVLLIFVTSVVLGAVNYITFKGQLLRGIDAKLLAAAHLAALVPPEGYFDGIVDESSVSPDSFERIVGRNNELCVSLGLQYLWSCMVIDDRIVFTTSTSPGKDVTKGDHAGFLEAHGDPEAFDAAFSTMKPAYCSFGNEWGHGRMVLVPTLDIHGRKYCFGASMSINDVDHRLKKHRQQSTLIVAGIFVAGLLLSLFTSRSLSRPVVELTGVAESISRGDLEQDVDFGGSLELKSLSRSIDRMSHSIGRTIDALEDEIKGHREAEEELARHRDHLEEMVDERTQALKEAQEKLIVSERLAVLGQFAGSVAHEIRNPLGVISASNYYLKRTLGDDREKVRDNLDRIEDHVGRCEAIIDSILKLTRMKAPDLDRHDLLDILRRWAVSISTPETTVFELKIPEEPIPVLASRKQLPMALDNIINNALQVMEDGGILSVEVATVRDGESAWAEIRISDTGPGIEPENRERIFEPFYTTRTHGVGFGLSIARLVIERHHGRIFVETTPGGGAVFVIRLPIVAHEKTST